MTTIPVQELYIGEEALAQESTEPHCRTAISHTFQQPCRARVMAGAEYTLRLLHKMDGVMLYSTFLEALLGRSGTFVRGVRFMDSTQEEGTIIK